MTRHTTTYKPTITDTKVLGILRAQPGEWVNVETFGRWGNRHDRIASNLLPKSLDRLVENGLVEKAQTVTTILGLAGSRRYSGEPDASWVETDETTRTTTFYRAVVDEADVAEKIASWNDAIARNEADIERYRKANADDRASARSSLIEIGAKLAAGEPVPTYDSGIPLFDGKAIHDRIVQREGYARSAEKEIARLRENIAKAKPSGDDRPPETDVDDRRIQEAKALLHSTQRVNRALRHGEGETIGQAVRRLGLVAEILPEGYEPGDDD